MRTAENTTYTVEDTFDARYFNVLKLNTVKQCEIVLAEINYCIMSIKNDLIAGRDDASWAQSARRAVSDYEHKGRMVALRREELAEISIMFKAQKTSQEQLFYAAAKEILDKDMFEKIKIAAKSRAK